MSEICVLEYFDNIDSGDLVADREYGPFTDAAAAQSEAERAVGEPLDWVYEEGKLLYAYVDYPAGYVVRPLLLGVAG